MKYGIYAPYWTHEWTSDYEYYIPKIKKLGFRMRHGSWHGVLNRYEEYMMDVAKMIGQIEDFTNSDYDGIAVQPMDTNDGQEPCRPPRMRV